MTSAGHHVMLDGASAPPAPAYWGLCFTAEEPNVVVNMAKTGSPPAVTLETSTDGETWTAFDANGGTTPITLAAIGDHVFFRAGTAGNAKMSSGTTAYRSFTLSGKCAASGNCMSLISASDPTVVLTSSNTYAFSSLFRDCTQLTTVPELPSTTVTSNCYRSMFQGCTSLTFAHTLPATGAANNCYRSMFQGCTSLVSSPRLKLLTNWPTVGSYFPYNDIFSGCTSLSSIEVDFLPPLMFRSYYSGLFSGGATGIVRTFESAAEEVMSSLPSGWSVEIASDGYHAGFVISTRYVLTFTPNTDCRVSLDFGATWTDVPQSTPFSIGNRTAAMVEVSSPTILSRNYGSSVFKISSNTSHGQVYLSGDATSLAVRGGGLTSLPSYALYYACYKLVNSSNGISIPIGARFVRIPSVISYSCCSHMFEGCESLVSAPTLPATTLQSYCYERMFDGCTSLSWIDLAATSWGDTFLYHPFRDWVNGVAASGTFRCPTALGTPPDGDNPIERGTDRCPNGWTVVNTD